MVRNRQEAESLVVPCRLLIDGVNEQTDATGLRMDALRPGHRIDQQQLAEPLALEALVNGESAETHAWNAARKLLAPSPTAGLETQATGGLTD